MREFPSDDIFIKSLACAALDPHLRSILIFDAPYPILQELAEMLAQMLASATNQPVEPHLLNASMQDDDLWGSLPLPTIQKGLPRVKPAFRLFSQQRNSGNTQLITIPDLAKLGLAATRACVMLINSDVVHLERNGQQAIWQPYQCWLASCSNVGAVSPHLLDRFALRLTWRKSETRDWQQRSSSLLATIPIHVPESVADITPHLLHSIRQASQQQVTIPSSALARVLEYMPEENYYPRRELALARFAVALARLEGNSTLTADHVDEAATIFGLSIVSIKNKTNDQSLLEPDASVETIEQEQSISTSTITSTELEDIDEEFLVSTHEVTEYDSVITSENITQAYPEDEAPVEREAFSLKIPHTRSSTSRSSRGPIYGVEPSNNMRGLAIISTLTTAAMFQKMRGRDPAKQGLLIEKSDLRRYRRGYVTEQMFLLLLDYTCLKNCNWEDALLPYLSAAYIDRAITTIIKVGAKDARHPLQAEAVSAKNILTPKISHALAAKRGTATPLAHGLDLALQTFHRVLQHGRDIVYKVTFVVISDGRGNIPLEASRQKKLTSIISREGVEDALRIAHAIRELKHVTVVVLNPQPLHYPKLPLRLAEELGAALENIPSSGDQGKKVEP